MERDMNLVRALLLAVEASEDAQPGAALHMDGYDSAQVAYHLRLMAQAELLEYSVLRALKGDDYLLRGLTWKGHDLLDAIRRPRVWQQVKDRAEQAGVSLTMDITKELALAVIRSGLGLK